MQKGQHVLHPQHGIGKIESIREFSISGHAPASYAQLYFERDKLTMTLLEDNLQELVRKVISPDQAKSLLDQLNSWNGKGTSQWKARANAHQAALESGESGLVIPPPAVGPAQNVRGEGHSSPVVCSFQKLQGPFR